MLRRLDEDATLRGERDREIECTGRRSELKLVVIEIDRITSAIEYLKEIIPVSCAGSATATIYLTNHDLIVLRSRRWSWRWRRTCSWRRSGSWRRRCGGFPGQTPPRYRS